MNRKIKTYLKVTVKRINNPAKRKSAYIELRSHILDLVDKKIAEGLSAKDATHQTLLELPEPNKFGRKLNRASYPWYWRYPVITLSLISTASLMLSIIVGSHLFVTYYLKPKLQEHVIPSQTVVKNMIRDFETLDKINLFPPNKRTKNAAFYLNKYIGGVDRVGDKNSELEVAKSILQKYIGWESDKKILTSLLSDEKLSRIETSWLENLRSYDYVDFSELPEIQARMKLLKNSNSIEKISTWASMPILEVSSLQTWLTVYALKQHGRDNVQNALHLTSHVAGLVQSNGLLVDHLIAVSILKKQHLLAKSLNVDWQSVPIDILDAYKRVSWAWPRIINQSYHEGQIPKEFEKYAKRELGLCSGVSEYSMGFQGMSDFLLPSAPFETNFREELVAAKSLAQQLLKNCDRHDHFKNFLEETPAGKNGFWDKEMIGVWSMDDSIPLLRYLPNPSRLPYIRRVVIYYLMNIGIPSYIKPYEDLIAKEESKNKSASNN